MKIKLFLNAAFFALVFFCLAACSQLRREASFYAKHPDLIPIESKKISLVKTAEADTLKLQKRLSTANFFNDTNTFVFENERSKTVISFAPTLVKDSFSLSVNTLSKAISLQLDTTINYKQYKFTVPGHKNKISWWKRLGDGYKFWLFALGCILALFVLSFFKK